MKTTYLCGSPWLPDAVPVLGRDHNLALHGETGEPWGGEGPGNGHRVHSVDPPVPRVRDDHLQAGGLGALDGHTHLFSALRLSSAFFHIH